MAFSPSGGPPFRGPRGGSRFPAKQSKDEHRINEYIRVPKVRLVDEKGNQVGVVPTSEALDLARNRGLDLMEVAPNANPPVCKICDYGKFKYEKKKKEQVAKKKQVTIKVKEVQLRPSTEEHDLEYKIRNIRGFLEDGDKAKITMLFRGREVTHADQGYKIMDRLKGEVEDIAEVESPPKMEGRKMIMILVPSKKAQKAAKSKEQEK